MIYKQPTEKTDYKKRLFIPAILLAVFLVNSVGYFLSIVLIDIANSFQVSIGTASQLATVTRVCGLIIGLVMGVLTLRFKTKSLFLIGIALFGIGTLGSALVSDYITMILFQFFLGIGGPMVGVLSYSLIGAYLPLEKRGWAIGLVLSIIFITNVIVAPIAGIMTPLAGWRSVLTLFIFPISIASLFLAYLALPSEHNKNKESSQIESETIRDISITNQASASVQNQNSAKSSPKKAFKLILSSRSAIACMIGTMLISIFALTPMYAPSFFRDQFSVTVTIGGIFSAIAAATGIFGSLIAGRIVNQVGRKPMIIVSGIISGIANILFTLIPNVWGALAFWGIAAFTVSMTWTALYALVIEQVPSYRSSMVSINQTFRYLGAIIGLAISGFVLNTLANNYQILMIIFGSANIALAIIVFTSTTDPCKNALSA